MSYQLPLSAEFSGATDCWTEYLCIEVLSDGRIEFTSRSAEPLMGDGWSAGEVVWPDGYDPEEDDGDVLPLTVDGKRVAGRDGDFIVGEELHPHSDDAVAVFERGQIGQARSWLESYGWLTQPGIEDAWIQCERLLT